MIDTHCHIDDEQYAAELDAFIAQQKEDGVEQILVPATDAASCESVLAVCQRHSGYLMPALGLHPEEVREDWQEQLASIRTLILSTLNAQLSTLDSPLSPIIAIGEIGLDYHWDTTYKEEQKAALRAQLDWAIEWDLPVMLHARDCTDDILTILREYAPKGLRGVMHCFSGSYETAQEILRLGLYLGIGGVLTFKNCKLSEVLAGGEGRTPIPTDRILLETDAPYMAPVPHRGERNEPRWLAIVMNRLAEIYQISPSEVEIQTNLNAKTLFRL